MAQNSTDKFDALNTLGMDEFKLINLDKLKQIDVREIGKLLKIINELNLDDLSSVQMWTLSRLVHYISTIEYGDNREFYARHFIHGQGNIRFMINEPKEKSDKALFRSSKKTYDYSIGQKIDFGNRSFTETLDVAQMFAEDFDPKTIFHVYGEYYRINFKNDSMFYDELESRVKRGTTGVVKGTDVDTKGVQHYLAVIEEYPDEQKYDDNVTGRANTHKSRFVQLESANVELGLDHLAKQLIKLSAQTKTFASSDEYRNQIVLGRDIFNEIYRVGYAFHREPKNSVSASIKNSANLTNIVNLIKSIHLWLCSFIIAYPSEIEFDYNSPAFDICLTRSGIQFMFDLFGNIDGELDSTLELIKVAGNLKELDEHLLTWCDYYRDLKSYKIPSDLPKKHWWWFDDYVAEN